MKKKGNFLVLWMIFSVSAFAQIITITSPNGGETWAHGGVSSSAILWTYSGIPDSTLVKLVLFKDGNKIGNIAENVKIGSHGAGSCSWKIGDYVGGSAVAGNGYKIRVRDMNGQYPLDESNDSFTIGARILFSSPKDHGTYLIGEMLKIKWSYSGIPDGTLVKLALFQIGGQEKKVGNIVQNISIGAGGKSSYDWRVGTIEGGAADAGTSFEIRISDMGGKFPLSPWDDKTRFSIQGQVGNLPDLKVSNIFYDYDGQNGFLHITVFNNGPMFTFEGDFYVYTNMGGLYPPKLESVRGKTFPEGGTDLFWSFNWPEEICSLNFEATVDPNKAVQESNENNNTLQKVVYREVNAVHMIEFPFRLGRGQSQISVKKDEQVNFYSRENFSSSELHRDTSQFEIRFPVTVGIRNCGGKSTTQRVDLFVYGSSPSMNTDWPGENRTGIVLQPGEIRNYPLTVVVKMPWVPNKLMIGHFQVVLIENDGGHERKVISAHPVIVAGQLAQ
jgi:hypothetical protein